VPDQVPSVYAEQRTKHSIKPPYFQRLIDTSYPYGRRLELFAS
jgi:hypothetical protein